MESYLVPSGKRMLCLFLCLVLMGTSLSVQAAQEEEPHFLGMSDPALLTYLEESLANSLDGVEGLDYEIEGVEAAYLSKELLQEREYNSRKNLYFGFTLEELDARFEGKGYYFTLGEDGTTVVEEVKEEENASRFTQLLASLPVDEDAILLSLTLVERSHLNPAVKIILVVSAETVLEVKRGGEAMESLMVAVSRHKEEFVQLALAELSDLADTDPGLKVKGITTVMG